MKSSRHAEPDFRPTPASPDAVLEIGIERFAGWREWYAVVRYRDGRTYHSGPWNTATAAEYAAEAWRKRLVHAMAKRGATGNGDECPLAPIHGNMWVLTGSSNQWCPNHEHDMDGTRSRWPLMQFEEAVRTYHILTEKRKASALPDLTDLEVS